MPQGDIRQASRIETGSKIPDYSVQPDNLDTAQISEVRVINNRWAEYNGYYLDIPEYQSAINAFATWVFPGWTADPSTTAILERIDGWGEDTFSSIMWNMLVTKKVQGDAFAEIIRGEDGALLNLIPAGNLVIVTNKKGRIIRYEDDTQTPIRTFTPKQILHLCNNRLANQVHGTAVTRSIKWTIDARNESMTDYRRVLHRSTVRILYVDESDKTRLANLKTEYNEGIKRGDVVILTLKKGEAEFEELGAPPIDSYERYWRYLENHYYQALGIPKVILGGTAENTEASAKVSVIVSEPVFERARRELEQDLWNQLARKLEIGKPKSLMDNMQTQEAKNPNQAGFQPNDVTAGVGK
ncbi:MAG TPA: hypothetical protein ENI13_00595 [candidate division CPR3 bacterium]|uniref:Phage portal protein n=1 Tax=candidate division CPR3 bacterium TaxID=2268181 RepID=A0A7C1T1W1_UNCC3|nr:hypothetical protein [candidate division CPR3 bacterium]